MSDNLLEAKTRTQMSGAGSPVPSGAIIFVKTIQQLFFPFVVRFSYSILTNISQQLTIGRHALQHFLYVFHCKIEPVASVRPKFSSIDDSHSFSARSRSSLTLQCPAQGFPVPSFRYD